MSRAEFETSELKEFSLAPNLTELFSDSEYYLDKSKEPELYPANIYYENGYQTYEDLRPKSATFLRFRRSDLSQISVDQMDTPIRPFHLGAGYIIHVYPKTNDDIYFTDKSEIEHAMVPMELQFCAFVPNRDILNDTVTIQPEGCVNRTNSNGTNVINNFTESNVTSYVEYTPLIGLKDIHTCWRSRYLL